MVLEVGVLRAVPARARAHARRIGLAGEVGARVDHHGRRGRALLERGHVVEHLERGARLAQADARDVVLTLHARVVAVVVVDGADIRDDLTVARIDRHQRRVPDILRVQLLDPVPHLALGDLLLRHVERRRHLVAAARDRSLVAAQDRRELVAYLEDEVRRFDRRDRRPGDPDRFALRGFGLLLGDRAGVQHLVEHVGAPRGRAVQILGLRRIEHGRRLRQPSEERGLRERELRKIGLSEIGQRRGFDAVGLVPVVDLVEVELEDLLLRVRPRDLDGEDGLADLALEADLAADDPLLHELLRDGRRAALAGVAARQVGVDGADDAADVDTGIAPERLVLGRDGRVDEDLGHVLVPRDLAALDLELVQELVAGPVVDPRRLGEGIPGEVLRGGEILREEGERRGRAEQKEPGRREQDAEQARRQRGAPPAERSAIPAPLRAIWTAPERVVEGRF